MHEIGQTRGWGNCDRLGFRRGRVCYQDERDRAPRPVVETSATLMNAATSRSAITVRLRVRNGAQAEFLTWQARAAAMVAAPPGFVSIEFIPVLRLNAEWQMVLQFYDLHRLGEWRAPPERGVLYQELAALLDGAVGMGGGGGTMDTSAEPIPMCAATSYWAGIERIYYGATVGNAFE
jgi:hypothetical protein